MNRMRTLKRLSAGFLAVLGIACLPASAQLVSGNLSGTVYDVSGATVPNATVIAHNDATGVENTTISTSTGEYHIVNLPGGTYTLSVTATGFSKAELKDVQIELNVTSTANVTLQIGKSVETVEVSASRGIHRYHHGAASEHFHDPADDGSPHRVQRFGRH